MSRSYQDYSPLQCAEQDRMYNIVAAILEFPKRQESKEREFLTRQEGKERQFKNGCLKKFPTRATLDQELQRLRDLTDVSKVSIVSSEREWAKERYKSLIPLCDLPEWMSVPNLKKEILNLENKIASLDSDGPERASETQKLDELKQRLEQEQEILAEESRKISQLQQPMVASASAFSDVTGSVVNRVVKPNAKPNAKPNEDSNVSNSVAEASPAPSLASSSEDLQKKLAILEKKRERLKERAELAKQLDQDVGPYFEQIKQVDMEIDETDNQIGNM
jgi:hypothetical protein